MEAQWDRMDKTGMLRGRGTVSVSGTDFIRFTATSTTTFRRSPGSGTYHLLSHVHLLAWPAKAPHRLAYFWTRHTRRKRHLRMERRRPGGAGAVKIAPLAQTSPRMRRASSRGLYERIFVRHEHPNQIDIEQ
jgi:hypothetical protein